jgi:hypothetical protein
MKNLLLPLLSALLAGILGILATTFLAHHGLYAMILPGGLVGIGASLLRPKSRLLPFLTAPYALAISLFTEWHIRPFLADPSLPYFLTHLPNLTSITLLMITAGTLLAFFLPFPFRHPLPQNPEATPPHEPRNGASS